MLERHSDSLDSDGGLLVGSLRRVVTGATKLVLRSRWACLTCLRAFYCFTSESSEALLEGTDSSTFASSTLFKLSLTGSESVSILTLICMGGSLDPSIVPNDSCCCSSRSESLCWFDPISLIYSI